MKLTDIKEANFNQNRTVESCLQKPFVEVVAALIWDRDKDKFLICQRPANKARGLLWEFVGGKVERSETKVQALIRECLEELAITVEPHEIFTEVTHEYPDITIHLTLFNCSILRGQPQLLEHNDMQWITSAEIEKYEFCPADKEILEMISKGKKSVNLKELYDKILAEGDVNYYKDFAFDGDYLEEATRFIKKYFSEAGKKFLTEFDCYTPDDKDREFRNKHMVSAYLLGSLIAKNIYSETQLNIAGTDFPFSYVWYLICLFHDAGYGFENNDGERQILNEILTRNEQIEEKPYLRKRYVMSDFKRRKDIHSSIWFGHYKFSRRKIENPYNERNEDRNIAKEVLITRYYRKHKWVEFADGKKYNYPTYKSGLINKYFEYRLSKMGQIDHGITGGYVFFDTMIKNYIYCYNEVKQEYDCDFNDFYYNGKHYRIEQFPIFGYVADCIIAHNIWNGKSDEEGFRRFGLDSLIGDNYAKVERLKNPYLFVLALSDTLEPLKIFRDFNGTNEQLLRQINLEFAQNSLSISTRNDKIYNGYKDRLKDLEDWVDVKVDYYDDEKKIVITF